MAQLSVESTNFTGEVVPIKRLAIVEPVPTTEEIAVRGYDRVAVPETAPIDRANMGRPLLARQALDVAAVGITNFPQFITQLRKFEHSAEVAVEDGVLDLEADYPDTAPEARVIEFALDVIQEHVDTPDSVLTQLGVPTILEREEQHQEQLAEIKGQVKDRDRLLIREKATMLEILRVARASDASEELVEQIEMLAGLTPAPRVAELLEAQTKEAVAESEAKPVGKTKEFFRKALSGTALKMSGARQPRIIVE